MVLNAQTAACSFSQCIQFLGLFFFLYIILSFFSFLFFIWTSQSITNISVLIFSPLSRIIARNGGTPPLTYKKFLSIVHVFGPPKRSVPAVDMDIFGRCITPISEDHDDMYGVPTLEELGLDSSQLLPEVWHGGETEALLRLDRHLERKVCIVWLL